MFAFAILVAGCGAAAPPWCDGPACGDSACEGFCGQIDGSWCCDQRCYASHTCRNLILADMSAASPCSIDQEFADCQAECLANGMSCANDPVCGSDGHWRFTCYSPPDGG